MESREAIIMKLIVKNSLIYFPCFLNFFKIYFDTAVKYFLSVSIHLKCVCILRKPKSTLFANIVKGGKKSVFRLLYEVEKLPLSVSPILK